MSTQTVSENWAISFKIVAPIMSALIGLTVWLTSQLWKIEAKQSLSWTLHDQREWAKEVMQLNTNVVVPNPNDIFWSNRQKFTADEPVTSHPFATQ